MPLSLQPSRRGRQDPSEAERKSVFEPPRRFRRRCHSASRSRSARVSALQVTVEAILINILNPNLSIFFFAFLPQFVSRDEAHPLLRMLLLSGAFMLMTFVVFVGFGLFAAAICDRVIARPRVLTWMRRAFAGTFVALGVKLALAER
jgi:threonine/homoserine/homoserine lactone efflux protein